MPVEFMEPPAKPVNMSGFTAESRKRGSSVRKEKRVTIEMLMELARANGQWARVATGITSSAASAYRAYANAHPAIGLDITTRRNDDNPALRDVYARIY